MSIFKRFLSPKYSIGIDFGTTTSRICYVDNHSRKPIYSKISPIRTLVTPIPNEKTYRWDQGENVIHTYWAHYSKFKLELGNMSEIPLLPKRKSDESIEIRPEILAARIIRKLYSNELRNNFDLSKSNNSVSISVPAEWNAIERQATIMAAKIAGFNNIHLIEEPVAAFLDLDESRVQKKIRSSQNILVFDYGGGTLDITVIHRPNKGVPYVIGRSMNKKELAGEAIDEALTRRLISNDTWDSLTERDQRFLSNILRQMKEWLNPKETQQTSLDVTWPEQITLLDNKRITYPVGKFILTKKDLNETLDSIIDEVSTLIRNAVETASHPEGQISQKDIDVVLMVGGSSYLKRVQELILKEFPGKTFEDGIYLERPEEVVARGTALYQSHLDTGEDRIRLKAPMFTYIQYLSDDPKFPESEMTLADPHSDDLPIKLRAPKTCPIPKNATSIDWTIYQKHTYSKKPPYAVEKIQFPSWSGKADRIRLEYEIDLNGCISKWSPKLIFNQKQIPSTGAERKYDYLNSGSDKPTKLAEDYNIFSE